MEGLLEPNARATGASRQPMLPEQRLISIALLFVAAVLLTAAHYGMTEVWWLASAERMASFEAAAPFQYRLLLPLVVAVLSSITSFDVATLFVLTEVVTWMLLVLVAERALQAFDVCATDRGRHLLAMTVVIPVAAHLIVPDLKIHSLFRVEDGVLQPAEWHLTAVFRYVYDLPAAAFTLGLVVVLHRFVTTLDRRWLATYLAVFALAALNRETTVFLIPVFLAVCYRRVDHRTLAGALVLQVALLFAIQTGLQWWFAGNVNPHANVPGTQYENHLMHNLGLLGGPAYLAVFLLRFGAGLYLPALLLHRYMDPFLGRTLLWFAVPFLVTTLVFGRIQEHRVMLEVAPLLWLGAVQAIAAYRVQRARRLSPGGDRRMRAAVNAVADPRADQREAAEGPEGAGGPHVRLDGEPARHQRVLPGVAR